MRTFLQVNSWKCTRSLLVVHEIWKKQKRTQHNKISFISTTALAALLASLCHVSLFFFFFWPTNPPSTAANNPHGKYILPRLCNKLFPSLQLCTEEPAACSGELNYCSSSGAYSAYLDNWLPPTITTTRKFPKPLKVRNEALHHNAPRLTCYCHPLRSS